MPIYDTYSKRRSRAEKGEPDVYIYDEIPEQLRNRICYILDDALGRSQDRGRYRDNRWFFVLDRYRKEGGLAYVQHRDIEPRQFCLDTILHSTAIDEWLTMVELCFVSVQRLHEIDETLRQVYQIRQTPNEAIAELNFRFHEAGIGYQFEGGNIIREDSQLIHAEVVKPALVLLSDARFKGAQEEFLTAHAHYRAGEYKDAVVDAHSAFESTMKSICDIKAWQYPKGARSSDLVKIIRREGLLPDYLDASFDQLIATLTSGLPRIRHETGGHGQGARPRATPGYIAGYALHLAAVSILLLAEACAANE